MQTIKDNVIDQYEIKKSKFITLIYRINSIDEINKLMDDIKNNYKDATHYCYAYKLNNIQRFNDDGEPNGTAGLPILEVLNKRNINNVLCVVIRYFGGIKLGAGGLVRAYSKAVRNVLDNSQMIELLEGYLIKIRSTYDEQKKYDYIFKDKILKKEYDEHIIYYIEIDKNELIKRNDINFEIIDTIWIEKN